MSRPLKTVDAQAAAALMRSGALMVDVREPGEFAAGRIPGSANLPLSRLEAENLPLAEAQAVVFFCAGGTRTTVNAARLAARAGEAEAYVMAGGIAAWGRLGLPVEAGNPGTPAAGGFFARLFGAG
jgi:rhodanese-related sulfurtransferase